MGIKRNDCRGHYGAHHYRRRHINAAGRIYEKVEDICRRHGALLICDEVICGFGRTGEPFGFMHYGVKPDIITMAKGITSAYLPLSATAVKRDIFEAYQGKLLMTVSAT